MSDQIKRIDYPADPDRCQGITANGQCQNKKIPGLQYCPIHRGNGEQVMRNKEVRNLQLGIWKARVENKLNSPTIKSLREEIGVLRLVLENIVSTCECEMDLITRSGPISDLIIKIEKLVASCTKLERTHNELLDKQQLLVFASTIVRIINENISDKELVNILADKIANAVVGDGDDD